MSNNTMDNGAVLPHGLLGHSDDSMMGFNQSFKNYSLKIGVVMAIYPVDDDSNISDLNTEYDVMVVEQNADKGATTITYKNCLAVDHFGSPADFFEKTFRAMEENTSGNDSVNLKDQNGATVLLLCLDGVSDKGIIIGALTHPDRDTTLETDEPRLEGEYNGVNIKIEPDGSCMLTFQGATDNDGEVTDDSQGDTTVQIETDGSVQIDHDQTTFRLDRNGDVTVDTTGNIIVNCEKDANVTATGDIIAQCENLDVTTNTNATVTVGGDMAATVTGNITADCSDATITASGTATVEGSTVKLGAGAAEAVVKGKTFSSLYNAHIHPTALGPSGPPVAPMDPSLSAKVLTE